MIAASSTTLSRHFAHLILFGAWFAVIVGVLLIDHIRERRRAVDEPDDGVDDINDGRELSAAAAAPARISMATWPPPRASATPSARRPPAPQRAPSARGDRITAAADPAVQSVWLPLAVLGSVAAAAVHLVVMPDHFAESYWYGAFFVCAAVSQLAYAWLLATRPSPTLLRAGAAGNALVMLLWAYTRVVGVPIGPDNGATESIGGLDLVATTAEALVLVACLCALWRHRMPLRSRISEWSVAVRSLVPLLAAAIAVAAVIGPRD